MQNRNLCAQKIREQDRFQRIYGYVFPGPKKEVFDHAVECAFQEHIRAFNADKENEEASQPLPCAPETVAYLKDIRKILIEAESKDSSSFKSRLYYAMRERIIEYRLGEKNYQIYRTMLSAQHYQSLINQTPGQDLNSIRYKKELQQKRDSALEKAKDQIHKVETLHAALLQHKKIKSDFVQSFYNPHYVANAPKAEKKSNESLGEEEKEQKLLLDLHGKNDQHAMQILQAYRTATQPVETEEEVYYQALIKKVNNVSDAEAEVILRDAVPRLRP